MRILNLALVNYLSNKIVKKVLVPVSLQLTKKKDEYNSHG